jgi:asparagine synthase (glutamine-hydrolysing)
MCGIAGYLLAPPAFKIGNNQDVLKKMSHRIMHRGPDDGGVWLDESTGIGLAHRRLSIVDLSKAGHQPMSSPSGRYIIAFNGEIYNHLRLRAELSDTSPHPWRGHSDTETLLAAIDYWGIHKTLEKCQGMFVFALWDKELCELVFARDRLGEKPLYYGWQGTALLFGSELKALAPHPSFKGEINRDALTLFFRHNYIPAPHSIYKGIYKLPPGTFLRVKSEPEIPLEPISYWTAKRTVEDGQASLFSGTETQAVDALEAHLQQAISDQMVADVPIGAFLSGGIDSSTIVALMQAQSSRAVKTFTIGFSEEEYNEAIHAKAVATHLGTDHTEFYVSASSAMDVIPLLPEIYDEPFSDSSQIPTFLVSKLAKAHVTVSLSGDGGDELFCGYSRYNLGLKMRQRLNRLPAGLRKLLSSALTQVSPQFWDMILGDKNILLPKNIIVNGAGDKVQRLAGLMAVDNLDSIYASLLTHWPNPELLVKNGRQPMTSLFDATQWSSVEDFAHRMMHIDMIGYLPDDILVKVDRAAMANSLETRVPFLDQGVVEFAWTLPLHFNKNEHGNKWLLRSLLHRYVPKNLVERPKMGFGVPIGKWLRGPLREWAEELLDKGRLESEGYLNSELVRQTWEEHLSGRNDWQYKLWDVLMFQSWLTQHRDNLLASQTAEISNR